MKLGISHQRLEQIKEDKYLHYLKQMGVNSLEVRIDHDQSSYETITYIKDRVEGYGFHLHEIMLNDKHNTPEVAIGLPGRDEIISQLQAFVRDLGRAGITHTTYTWYTLGIMENKTTDSLHGYLFIAPQLLGFVILVLGPLCAVLWFSFLESNILSGQAEFVGLKNYVEMFQNDPLFWKVINNSLIFAFGLVPLNVSMALVLAVLVNRAIGGITFFRVIFFSPVVTSAVAWAIVWKFLLQGEQGTINQYLGLIGIDGPNWLREPEWAMFSVIVSRAFKGVGINMILFLAALTNIPKSYQEAALIDGANRWQIFRYITLPLLASTTLLVVILTLIGTFQVFDTIFLMTGGGPANSTMVLVYYIYYQGFQFFETGYASALSVILFIITFALALVQWSIRHRVVYNEK